MLDSSTKTLISESCRCLRILGYECNVYMPLCLSIYWNFHEENRDIQKERKRDAGGSRLTAPRLTAHGLRLTPVFQTWIYFLMSIVIVNLSGSRGLRIACKIFVWMKHFVSVIER